MKPKDLLNWRLEEFVIPRLQSLGFKYSKSQRTFKRKVGSIGQEISIELRSKNYEDSCGFFIHFRIYCKDFQRWRDEHVEENIYKDYVWGGSDWLIPGWPQKETKRLFGLLPLKKGLRRSFHLTNTQDDEIEMRVLRECLEGPLLKYFDELSSLDAIAEEIQVKDLSAIARACDIHLFLGQVDKATRTIEEGLRQATDFKLPDVISELEFRRERIIPKLR